ncbi:Smad nuclear-interacting protein [Dirofilaria immitis]
MTRKRRNGSSSSSEKLNSSEIRRSVSPSTSRNHSSRYHSAHSSDDFSIHCKDSSGRKHAGKKDYSHRHRVHRLNDSKISDEKRNRHVQDDKEKSEKGKYAMDGRHRRSRNDDDDVAGRFSSDEVSGKEKKRIKIYAKDRSEENRDSARKYGSHKRMKKKFDEKTDRKLSTSNIEEESFKNVAKDHSGRLQDPFGEYLRNDHDSKEKAKIEKEKPNFEPSGKLAEDTNTYRGVVIKYNEPSDAHKPKLRWRLYPFKGDEALPVLYIHRQSAYLIGRDRKIADLPVDHPSCSKQHAVFQYRLTPKDLPDGTTVKRIRPYIIDLNSANGTYLNNERIESQRFVELREKDVLKFGFSTREFVLLNEKSHDGEDMEMMKKELSPS